MQLNTLWQFMQVDMEADGFENRMRQSASRQKLIKQRDFLKDQQVNMKKLENDVAVMQDRLAAVQDEAERLAAARLLGERYNPGCEEALRRELAKGLARMLVLCLDVEHMTGKEAIELTRRRQPRSVEEQA